MRKALNLDADAAGGSITIGLPVQVEGKVSGDNLKGTVNAGRPMLKLETSGGDIEVIKG